MNALVTTAAPGVYLHPASTGGDFYVLQAVGTPFVRCSCPAGQNDRECKHVVAALKATAEGEIVTTPDRTSTALVAAQKSTMVVKAEEARLQAASRLGAWKDALSLGRALVESGLMPKGVEKPEAAALIVLKAIELGIPPVSAFEFIDVIEGRPRLRAQMIGALVDRSGKGYIHIAESTPDRCTAIGYRTGRPTIKITCTLAQFAHLAKRDVWMHYPGDMLRAKAIARVGRVMFADVLGGMDASVEGELVDTADELGASVGEVIEGEAREVPAEAPAPAVPAYEWGSAFKAELRESGLGLRAVAEYLGLDAASGVNSILAAIDAWLTADADMTPRALVRAVADREAQGATA
jgi:hypothetical protein